MICCDVPWWVIWYIVIILMFGYLVIYNYYTSSNARENKVSFIMLGLIFSVLWPITIILMFMASLPNCFISEQEDDYL